MREPTRSMMPIRQTQSYLRNLFTQHGISPQRRLGQNFLIDLNIHDLIVDAAGVSSNDVILEVGSGTGALTSLMAARGADVVAVDIHPAMAKLTAQAVAGLPNVRVIDRDALASKSRLDPAVLDHVRAALGSAKGKQLKLVANLPYHVATPLIVNLLIHPELCPDLMVVTIQKELADRMSAQPATSAYGALSVVVQGLADVSIVRSLPPTVFWPRPQVDSAVVAIRPDAAKRAAVGDVAWFHEIVRRLFSHRRKYIRHVLAGTSRDQWNKAEVDAWLESQRLSGQLRAESLNVDQFLALAKALRERWGNIPGDAIASADDVGADAEREQHAWE
jgi:16S rRNA (adenine1518-N6/adenine1519-N6)-dimethyltransferase